MPEVVFNVRPYSELFLNELAQHFEIIVFTAAEQAVSCQIFYILLVPFLVCGRSA
jgi:TFIIF-interacting CTD phosphatase-like protein